MPFDGLAHSQSETLYIAALKSGIRILDLDLLERHKAAEVGRHPPGWSYRHRAALRLAFGVSLIAGFVGAVVLGSSGFSAAALLLGAGICGLVIAALAVPMRGPAHWEERLDPDLALVPARIAASARRLREEMPQARFRIGELYQDRVQLDPYLVAEHDGARVLLGIWDGDRVILCA